MRYSVYTMISVALFASAAFAQKTGDVVRVKEETRLMIERTAGEQVAAGATFVVADVDGDWLWIRAGEEGWIPKSNVEVVEGAGEEFAKLPAAQQTALAAAWRRGAKAAFDGRHQVEMIDFSGRNVTRDALKELAPLTSMTELRLSLANVEDDDLVGIEALGNLQSLYLGANPVGDAGLKHVAKLKNLRSLGLMLTAVTDAGLAELAALKDLEELRLSTTAVTDRGIAHLAACKSLKRLEVSLTGVTFAGAKKLQQALPELRIER